MNKSRKFIYILITFILAAAYKNNVYAVTTPTFPSCENPQGILKVSYSFGIHGVPGNTTSFTGSDSVYTLTQDTLTQCLCTINEDGIQTNWWKVSSLSFEEIETLQKLGWIFIPNGADWGLEEAPYMAHNTSFDCNPEDGKDDGDDKDDNDESDDEDDDDQDGEILGISTRIGGLGGQVLGLASTGNGMALLSVLTVGLLASFGFLLALKNPQNKQ